MRLLWNVPLLFALGIGLFQPVWASIYTYITDEGVTLSNIPLSNTPGDDRYKLAVKSQNQPGSGAVSARASLAPPRKAEYERMVDEVAGIYGLESALLHAVITVESRYVPDAVSRSGAVGLMQLMPVTAKRYGVANVLDPVQNLHGGAKCLRDLLKRFNNDVSLALAAYNAGEGAVVRSGYRIPPYPETVDYVPKVLGFYRQYQTNLL
jgi:soluble lytic murein transglycosylase-like protein